MSDGKAKGGGAGYDFEVFREACKQGDVFIFKISEVKKDAKRLNLFSEKEILQFVAQPPDRLTFKDSRLLENDLFKSKGAAVDAYYFGCGQDTWYLAFLMAVSRKWVLKSFKPSDVLQAGDEPEVASGYQLGEAFAKALRGKNK